MSIFSRVFKVLLLSLLLFNLNLFAFSQIDKLVKDGDIETLKKLIKKTKIIDNEIELPLRVKEHDLIIIDNEYEVKSLFEFHDGRWNDKVYKIVAKLLENDSGTTYGNLFNYKVNAKEFKPYESDDFKYGSDESKMLIVKIIKSLNNEKSINKNISEFLKENLIDASTILNIQFFDMDKIKCKIIITYRD